MRPEKRRSDRRPFGRKAWVDLLDGSPAIDCIIGNLSETGAKLIISSASELPKEFVLWFTPDGRVARKCRTAWKSAGEAGVAFTARLVKASANPGEH